jgi:PKD repeat protein
VAKEITLTGSDADGNTLTFAVVSSPSHGTLGTVSSTGVVTYTPTTDYVGADSFTFKVNDGTVDSAPATVDITVNAVNTAPVANAQSVSTDKNTPKEITLTGSDAEGSTLTFAVATAPTHGSLGSISAAGVVTYTPTADFVGADSFTFTVNDGTVDSAPATVSIMVNAVNTAPVADAQSVSTDKNIAKIITLTGSDAEGSTLTYAVSTTPTHGTLGTISATGVVTYTPTTSYVGPDSFTFTVNDGTVDSAPATVSITVNAVNTAPVANAQSVSTDKNVAKEITLTGSDAEGSTLTFTAASNPSHGSLGTISSAGVVTYTPTTDYVGSDSFTFTASDGTLNSAPATVSITVNAVILAPVVNFIGDNRTGDAPLHVHFTDQSTNTPTAWAWDFQNDGIIDSNDQNPSFTYTSTGTFQVNLTATNAVGSKSRLKANYITVNAAPVASMTVVKSASASSLPESGGEVTYTYLVENTGSVSLSAITLTDDKLGTITGPASGDTNTNGVLDAGETWTYTATTTLTTTTTNTAIASGSIPGAAPVSSQSNAVTVHVGETVPTPEFPTLAFPVMVIAAFGLLVMVVRKE